MPDTSSPPAPGNRGGVALVVIAFPVVVGIATTGISDGWLGPDPVQVQGTDGVGTVPSLPGLVRPELDGLVGLDSPRPVSLGLPAGLPSASTTSPTGAASLRAIDASGGPATSSGPGGDSASAGGPTGAPPGGGEPGVGVPGDDDGGPGDDGGADDDGGSGDDDGGSDAAAGGDDADDADDDEEPADDATSDDATSDDATSDDDSDDAAVRRTSGDSNADTDTDADTDADTDTDTGESDTGESDDGESDGDGDGDGDD